VGKKLKEYLGVEEQNLIDLIVRKVEKKCPPQEILDKCETFLEEIAEEFVVKMWKIIIFEILKVENNITE
jgi:RNA-binding protein 25